MTQNPDLNKNTHEVICNDTFLHFWSNRPNDANVIRWVYTKSAKEGCFVIAYVSDQACYMLHSGALSPRGAEGFRRRWNGPSHDINRTAEGEIDKFVSRLIDYICKELAEVMESFQHARCFIMLPEKHKHETESEGLCRKAIEEMAVQLEQKLGIRPWLFPYNPKTGELLPDYSAMEVNMPPGGGTPHVWFNAMPPQTEEGERQMEAFMAARSAAET